MEEEDNRPYSEGEETKARRPHRGGIILRLEPASSREILAYPMAVTCFKHVGCFDFYELVQNYKP